MRKAMLAVVALLAIGLVSPAPADQPMAAATPRRVRVLFLGDRGPHEPLLRCRQAYSAMAHRGIDLTYTESLADVNGQTLGRYDCLLLYADLPTISAEQSTALLDYVAAGHGFVAIHSAASCFANDPRFAALVGGRSSAARLAKSIEQIVAADHPIELGLKPVQGEDESLKFTDVNDNGRTVLSVVPDINAGGKAMPQTWVRAQEKGRVFYTAWGHGEKTWGDEGFQALLERGIRWSAGDSALHQPPPPSVAEMDSGAPIPNYLPSKKWGTEGEPLRRMQVPLPPEESMKHMVLPPGFEAKLFASDPDIYKPICMAFDDRGRLWVAETTDYPNSMQASGEGHDRIVICEDSTGSGKADKFTVFADKLSIPTSMCFANGGVIVSQAPDLLFLKSTKGDDKADVRQVLFTGFGTRDTHAGPSNLRWGFDNWVYGAIGYSGFKGTVGGQPASFGQGLFRFKPDGSKIEFLGSTTNNTWGLGFSEDGNLFASTANHAPSFYMHIPNRYYEQVKGWAVKRLEPINDSAGIFPVTEKVRQMDHHSFYTAGAGHALYTARSLPREYWNRVAFVAEPTAHLLGKFVLEPSGSAFRAVNNFNLLGSDDEWTAPITGEVGPDGAVWMIDWYNFIVQHNPIPRGFKGGKGGAYLTPLRDQTHGRVYRLVYVGAKPSQTFDLSKMPAAQLVDVLKSDNMLWRMHAQRLLVEKGDKSVIPALAALVNNAAVDEIGIAPAAVHALWTIDGLGGFGEQDAVAAVERALKHPSAAVRKAAADVLPRTAKGLEAILAAKLPEDADPQVRKSGLLALSEMPTSDAAGAAVYAILDRPENATDAWVGDAAAIAGSRHDAGFLKAVFAAHPASAGGTTLRSNAETRVIGAVINQYAQRGPVDSVVATLSALKTADPSLATDVLAGLAKGWPRTSPPKLSDADVTALRQLMGDLAPDARTRLLALAERWDRKDLFATQAAAAAGELRTAVANGSLDPARRADAAKKWIGIDDSLATLKLILKEISPQATPELQAALLDALGDSRNAELGRTLLAQWASLTPASQQAAVNLLIRREPWADDLLAAIKAGKVGKKDLLPQQWQTLASYPNPEIASRAKELQKAAGGATNPDRAALVEQAMPLLKKEGDAAKGRLVFEKNCLVCHTIEGQGGKVGPDLTGIGARPKVDNLIQLLDPNRSVEGTYKQWTATTKEDVISGRLYSESKTSVEIIDAAGQIHSLQRDQLKSLKASDIGVMPEGFEQLPPDDIVNVLEYLATSKVKH